MRGKRRRFSRSLLWVGEELEGILGVNPWTPVDGAVNPLGGLAERARRCGPAWSGLED